VDKELLCSSSKFYSDMLSTCDTQRVAVDEPRETLELALQVMRNQVPAKTFDELDGSCWEMYKRILVVADKYDMPVVRERCEKWLVSRCLRGKVRCSDFRFQEVSVALEWLILCQKYNLRCLGWYVAYDLGTQLAAGIWPAGMGNSVTECCQGITDPEFLKVILEAVADSVRAEKIASASRRHARSQVQASQHVANVAQAIAQPAVAGLGGGGGMLAAPPAILDEHDA